MTSPADAAKAAEMSAEKFGSLQVLVNCAGIGVAKRIFNARKNQLHSLDEFQRVININLNGSFNMMSQAVKVSKPRKLLKVKIVEIFCFFFSIFFSIFSLIDF